MPKGDPVEEALNVTGSETSPYVVVVPAGVVVAVFCDPVVAAPGVAVVAMLADGAVAAPVGAVVVATVVAGAACAVTTSPCFNVVKLPLNDLLAATVTVDCGWSLTQTLTVDPGSPVPLKLASVADCGFKLIVGFVAFVFGGFESCAQLSVTVAADTAEYLLSLDLNCTNIICLAASELSFVLKKPLLAKEVSVAI
jgi:hypothetical protein